jgi:hypothetical protein
MKTVGCDRWLDGALQMSGMALPTGILVVTGSTFEPSVEDKPNSHTNSHAYSCTCTDTAYCCTNTYTNRRSDNKCEEPQVNGNTHLRFLVARFMFHCMYSLDLLMIIASLQSTPPNYVEVFPHSCAHGEQLPRNAQLDRHRHLSLDLAVSITIIRAALSPKSTALA